MPKYPDDPLFAREAKPHKRWPLILLLFLLLFIGVLFIVNSVINRSPHLLEQNITIPSMSSSHEGFRILHISDLHGAKFGQTQEDIYAAIKNSKFNIVCISGDVTGDNGDFTAFIELIDMLASVGKPIYFIAGDEDPEPILSGSQYLNTTKAEFVMAAEKRGAIFLDAPVLLSSGKSNLWLCPDSFFTLDTAASQKALLDYLDRLQKGEQTDATAAAVRAAEYRLDVLKRTEEARLKMLSTDTYISLTHVPYTDASVAAVKDSAASVSAIGFKNISLVLSGHYNNGQFRLPGLGAIYVYPSSGLGNDGWFPDNSRVSGLAIIQGISQYISPGLGSAKQYPYFPWRFLNQPALTLIKLTTKLTN